MLDEEPGFGFSLSSLETLNTSVENYVSGTPGIIAAYHSLVGYSYAAPQAYQQTDVNYINDACNTYKSCTNLVTINTIISLHKLCWRGGLCMGTDQLPRTCTWRDTT